jgi:ATP phosphoribosyltransferase regulatory subunit
MKTWRFHTPDGVADILPDDCARKRDIEAGVRGMFRSRGFREIQTPGIEFYDVYAAGDGFVPQENLFKFFDSEGRILCMRYDGTVPAARCALTTLKDEPLPLRLCYIGDMYRYNESGGGRQSEFTQAGAEILGSSAPEADAEILGTAITATREAGIRDLQVSIGQVGFFQGLCREWGLDGEVEAMLPALIDSKQLVAIEDLCRSRNLPDNVRKALLQMPSLQGTYDVLDRLEPLAGNPASQAALDNLRSILSLLEDDGLLDCVSVDMGMLQDLHYYSGAIFKGFTYGIGFPLFGGGRYDHVAPAFGGVVSATGFSLGVNMVMTALRRQGDLPQAVVSDLLVGYASGARREAVRILEECRGQGMRAELDCCGEGREGLAAQATRRGIFAAWFVNTDGAREILPLPADRGE